MGTPTLAKLAKLITQQREALLSNWRQQVGLLPSAKSLDLPTLNDHVPALLDELAKAFAEITTAKTIAEGLVQGSPPAHGLQRLQISYDIEEVVAEYNILRGCIHDVAEANKLNLQGHAFRVMNRVFDTAIGQAVQRYSVERALEIQRRREDYLAFVAHDLRTPLNAISLAAKMLDATLHNRDAGTQTASILKTLHRNVKHLEVLVSDVLKENINLEAEAGIKLELRNFDLWPLVELLIHDLYPVAGTTDTQLINQIPDELIIYADAALLRRVFQNLIANAIASTPRGEVRIGARPIENHAVECWVNDNGEGIPADRLEVIFEKLETDSNAVNAVGLGLTIVKTFVEAHAGTVSVTSQIGVGSTFTFIIPRSVE
jgi:signal transduction histidine kinase